MAKAVDNGEAAKTGAVGGEVACVNAETESLRNGINARMGEMAILATMYDLASTTVERAKENMLAARASAVSSETVLNSAEKGQSKARNLKDSFVTGVKADLVEIYNQGVLSLDDVMVWLRVTLAEHVADDGRAENIVYERMLAIRRLAGYSGELMVLDFSDDITNRPNIHEIEPPKPPKHPEFMFETENRLRMKLTDTSGEAALIPIVATDLAEWLVIGKDNINCWLSKKLTEVEEDIVKAYSLFRNHTSETVDLLMLMEGRFTEESEVSRLRAVQEKLAAAIGNAIKTKPDSIQHFVGCLRKMPDQWRNFDNSMAIALVRNSEGQVESVDNNFPLFFVSYMLAVAKDAAKVGGENSVNLTAECIKLQEQYISRGKDLIEAEATGNA